MAIWKSLNFDLDLSKLDIGEMYTLIGLVVKIHEGNGIDWIAEIKENDDRCCSKVCLLVHYYPQPDPKELAHITWGEWQNTHLDFFNDIYALSTDYPAIIMGYGSDYYLASTRQLAQDFLEAGRQLIANLM